MTPRRLFRTVAVAEAVTWTLLLLGMFLKYVTHTTDLGVRVFGMTHGVVFLAYCLATVVVSVEARWPLGRTLLALAAAIPPLATLLFEWDLERRAPLATSWRLRRHAGDHTLLERGVHWLLHHPVGAAVTALGTLVVLTGTALVIGPPTS